MAEIETANDQLVGRDGNGMIRVVMPNVRMTPEQALRQAAWLVVMAGDDDEQFATVLAAVRNT